MKIIVLAGGLSTERDVSLASAAGICRTLLERGHDAFLLDVFLGLTDAPDDLEEVFTLPGHGLEIAKNIGKEEPDLAAVRAARPDQSGCFPGPNVIELCRLADITFIGLHGGEGENGKLQATFDLLGIRYTGPDSLGCAVAMDKDFTRQIFLQSGIDTPRGVCLRKDTGDHSLAAAGLSLPVVVKPCSGGSSIGVYIVDTEEEYVAALERSFQYEDEVIVEDYIKGREFACGIVGDKVLPPIEIIPKTGFFDYANKYQAGATDEICPADIPEETDFGIGQKPPKNSGNRCSGTTQKWVQSPLWGCFWPDFWAESPLLGKNKHLFEVSSDKQTDVRWKRGQTGTKGDKGDKFCPHFCPL